MRYTYEFKRKCVEMYRQGMYPQTPEGLSDFRFHKTVRQLFEERGEDGFREIEKKMLHEVAEFENVIVATGGGTPCFFDNMEYMNTCGDAVFLDVDKEVLFRRLRIAKQQRPLLVGKTDDELRELIDTALAKRLPYYRKARYEISGNELEDRSQIKRTVESFKKLLGI